MSGTAVATGLETPVLWTLAVCFICVMEWYIKEPIISRRSFYDLFK